MFHLPDGSTTIVYNSEDFKNLVHDKLGYEAATYVEELVYKGDKAYYSADSDFKAYEMQVEEQRYALLDIQELTEKLITAKPKEREELIRRIQGVIRGHI